MIIVTTDSIPGREIIDVFGLVRGTTVRAGDLAGDFSALLSNLVGGEIHEYTKLMAETREQALDRMIADAQALGANAILGVRFTATEIASGAAEMMVYGTAVLLLHKD
jgi:uncharacterized protein YbjQ (UPF0145 family)